MIQRMMPIDGSSKAKRLKWGPYQNHLSWAYMKELREKDKTLKIYDVPWHQARVQKLQGIPSLWIYGSS